ncbi:malonyl-ACP O-methyltransferase BioC [Desulfobulbus propionicus]|jgi:malonyl-ACP O-methyltransferase BioC
MYDVTQSIPMIPDKKLIRLRFEQAAATYEQQAAVQHRVAERLLALLADAAPGLQPRRALEIGCCTGLLTQRLLECFPDLDHLTVSDLVAAFEACIRGKIGPLAEKIRFVAGDIESVRLPGSYDLIISSSTLHWVHDLPALCGKLRRHLHPNGLFALSLYGKDNLREIRTVTGVGLVYRNLDQLLNVMSERFEILAAEEAREILRYADPLAVLKHLRATGVNAIGQQAWTRRQVNEFIQQYQTRFGDGQEGVRLTYHPMFVIARPRA